MVVEVSIELPFVLARFEFAGSLNAVCRAHRLSWSPVKRCWYRKIGTTTGSAEDRAAELVRALMDAGAIVTCAAPGVLERAASGEAIEPEHPRWVMLAGDGFALKSDCDIFAAATQFAGMAWSRAKKRLEAPPERFLEVEDLAAVHDFRFTPKAAERLAQLKKAAGVKEKSKEKAPDGVFLDLLDD